MTRPKAIVSWSGGKDCLLALDRARDRCDVVALLTTVTPEFGRVSMHGVRIELIEQQAASLGLPLHRAAIPWPCRNEDYERVMRAAWADFQAQGAEHVICGDLFLEDIRRYREERLFGPAACVFPLWGEGTHSLARAFLDQGYEAVVCCVDTLVLPAAFAGRPYDEFFLADLPPGVDPCGERGEFHTFVHAGPTFARPVRFTLGERTLRDERFAYCDLVPEEQP
jgi:uncharacterized protein (TIGR00290 family)